jgi:hypothetical protein
LAGILPAIIGNAHLQVNGKKIAIISGKLAIKLESHRAVHYAVLVDPVIAARIACYEVGFLIEKPFGTRKGQKPRN